MSEHDFKEWNKAFNKLRHKHDTWQIFSDWLDLTIDGFTIPGMKPMFNNKEKYTPDEYKIFDELFIAYMHHMEEALETRDYYDFLGYWWESDQNMTNKFKAQFFTPTGIAELMCQLTLNDDLTSNPKVMSDCCCGSGRFGLAWHKYRPQDFFFFNDLDMYAVKMTLVNMVVHGMRGVVAYQNTLTEEVFGCWQVTPYFSGGLPYIVPYGTNLSGACSMLPEGKKLEAPSIPSVDNKQTVESVTKCNNKCGLDAWL